MCEDFLKSKIDAIENTRFIHIPGPNPILKPGKKGTWDDGMMEMSNVFCDGGKVYIYYHATGMGKSYRIGVAVADNPLGPFTKYGDKPILEIGEPGSWEDLYVACATILKEGDDKYYMFYSASNNKEQKSSSELPVFHVGLATADNPLGPWKKYENNPIIPNFGYVGGIVKKDGKYYMFNEHHVGSTVVDYGPISLATADKPEGPWTICDDPVLNVDDWGTWDDAGYSESNVVYDGSIFKMFYGGAKKDFKYRLQTTENIGLAYSTDGHHFTKYGRNPIIKSNRVPYGAAFAEVCTYAEGSLLYLYHTLRYTKGWYEDDIPKYPNVEHIGVEVLSQGSPFALNMPLLVCDALEAETAFADRGLLPVNIENIRDITLYASCRYGDEAKKGLLIRVKSSVDGYNFDTKDACVFEMDVSAGETVRQSFTLKPDMHYIYISVENTDKKSSVTDINVVGYMRG